MKKYREITVVQKELEFVVCNMCGQRFEASDFLAMNRINSFNIKFGYGSNHDMEKWEFDLCEDCVEKIVDKFTVPFGINWELPF